MDQCLGYDIPGTSSGTEFTFSQNLFSDQELSDHDTGEEDLITPYQRDTSSPEESSLFPDLITHPPTRTKRTRGNKKVHCPPAPNITSDSSDYELPLKKLSLKEIFDNHFHKKRKLQKERQYKRAKEKNARLRYLHTKRRRKVCIKGAPSFALPLNIRKRRMLLQGIRFSFTSNKYLPLKLCFSYEQSVLFGFMNYVKKIKYEKHLKNSLHKMDVAKDVEEGNFETRKHEFLDDEESLSPISESGDNETEDHDAVIVENNSVILDYRIPSKKEWQIRRKQSKA